jgi:hypothetical protein
METNVVHNIYFNIFNNKIIKIVQNKKKLCPCLRHEGVGGNKDTTPLIPNPLN